MATIHIEREHKLGLAAARKLAFRWAEAAEEKLGMECVYEEGRSADRVIFTRSGVQGELDVTASAFVLDARLGILLGAFRDRIETEIVKNLDELLAHPEPHKVFDRELERRTGARKPAAKAPAKSAPAKGGARKKA